MFLLPGIEIDSNLKSKFRRSGFINTYLTCEPYKYPYEVIFLLFQPKELDLEFYEFTEELQTNANFIEIIEFDKKQVLIVYRIPAKFKNDYNLFMKGRYSRLSDAFKKCFVLEDYQRDTKGNPMKDNKGNYLTEPSTFYHVFNRTEFIKERWLLKLGYPLHDPILDSMELYDVQSPDKESLELIEAW